MDGPRARTTAGPRSDGSDALIRARFVRLAAASAGTLAAFVYLEDGMPGAWASHGLLDHGWHQDEWSGSALDELGLGELGPGVGVGIIPDLRKAGFGSWAMVAGAPFLRFLAHLPLTSEGGERLGFLCVMDPVVREGLTAAQEVALGDAAALMVATIEQQRLQAQYAAVSVMAERSERMLGLVTESASCAEALTKLLEELCRHHGAIVGRIWRLAPSGEMQELSRFNAERLPEHSYYRSWPTSQVGANNSRTAQAIRLNVPQSFLYSDVADQSRWVLMAGAIASGLRCQVSFPIWLQEERFGVSLAFDTERDDLVAIEEDIAALANSIRPALFRKVTEDRIRHMAHHDDLTQLDNRTVFQERLARAAGMSDRRGDLALLYLDLDGFKQINDQRGHEAGDKLLMAVAARLRAVVRSADAVARIGGDEFAVIQHCAGQPYAAVQLAQRLLETVGEPFQIDGEPTTIGVSIGIAIHPADGETPDALQRSADIALYSAKAAGRNGVRLFDPILESQQMERRTQEQDLKVAIERQDFTMAYQPICDSGSLEVLGMEALLRWTHATRGIQAPARFVPIAEATGLIVPLGRWALQTACAEAASWAVPVCLSVNFSPLQFRQAGLARQIENVLRATGLPGSRLDLEVTEGLLLDDSGEVLRTIHELREQGVRITLDDFGTAYASLSYLRRFPFDRLKIDRSFVQAMDGEASTLAIVEAILSLSERLKIQVVAEGVETEQELAMLRRMGCPLVQGFLMGRPMPDRLARQLLRG